MEPLQMEPIVSVGSHDLDRWSPQKQHDLFDKIKSKNVKVYEKLLTRAKSMNGHSLDMISIATKMTWQQVVDAADGHIISTIIATKMTWQQVIDACDGHIIRTIINQSELAALYLEDQEFINWVMQAPKAGEKFIRELKDEYY